MWLVVLITAALGSPPRTAVPTRAVPPMPAPCTLPRRPVRPPSIIAPAPILLLAPPAAWSRGFVGPSFGTHEPRRPPALPRVPAEPVPTTIGTPGVLTPIDQLPSAFAPIEEAPNRLPVTRIRPVE